VNARRAFEARYTGAANVEMLVRIYQQAQQKEPRTNASQNLTG